MICKKCNSKNIKIRSNSTHGKGSKAKKSMSCMDCGSYDIEIPVKRVYRRRK